jgi:hypothetical protein
MMRKKNYKAGIEATTPLFMSLHVTSYTKCFAAALMRALEGLLAGVAVTVDMKAAGL